MSKDLIINNISPFDLALTLDCGQAFRWSVTDDGCFEGIVMGKYLKIKQQGNSIIFYNTSQADYDAVWKSYFDFDRDYNEILLKASKNELLKSKTRGKPFALL